MQALPPCVTKYDVVGGLVAFEAGLLMEEEVAELFQVLVDTGIVWSLQGSYQRAAVAMLRRGIIAPQGRN
jgi:hypothetical protein